MKKMLCLALTVVMGMAMSTTAFAKVGSGDVNHDNLLDSGDAAAISQYAIDPAWGKDPNNTAFDVKEANFNGTVAKDDQGNLVDFVDSADCAALAEDSLADIRSRVMITATVGRTNPVTFTEAINTNLDHTSVLQFVDDIMGGKYDTEIGKNMKNVNSFVNNIKFTGNSGKVSIRTDAGWAKFEDAVSTLIADKAAFDSLKVGDTQYTTVDQLKGVYATAKTAFKPQLTQAEYQAAADKVVGITGADFITVAPYGFDENDVKLEGKALTLSEIAQVVGENGLYNYGSVTIDDVQEVIGSNFVVTVVNPNTGVSYKVDVNISRK